MNKLVIALVLVLMLVLPVYARPNAYSTIYPTMKVHRIGTPIGLPTTLGAAIATEAPKPAVPKLEVQKAYRAQEANVPKWSYIGEKCTSDGHTIQFTIRRRTCNQLVEERTNRWSCAGKGAKCIGFGCIERFCGVQRQQITVFT
ncbi:hypothetical protein HY489_04475 [Candidatus Woesearchaeota archaeon]|nr:hypothetical protein [Candidatus Woesearchaeota archaeon]